MANRDLPKSVILVTGGTGYIGSALIELLLPFGHEIRVLSRKPQGDRRVSHFHGDVTSADAVRAAAAGANLAFHLAGQTSVPRAEADPVGDRVINVGGIENLTAAFRDQSVKATVVQAGTITQVGLPAVTVIDESTPDHPVTVYDAHKLEAERALLRATEEGHVRGVTLRLATVYGPGPTSTSPDRGVLNQFVRKALKGDALTVFGHGEYLRDYIYVKDVAAAFLAAAASAAMIAGQHFVIGSGEPRTFAGAVSAISSAVAKRGGAEVPIQHIDEPASMNAIDRRNYIVDATRFRQATGWCPTVTFEAGVVLTIAAAERFE